ncbi:hypothetical protein WA026_005041 [Henosepilachna vigintioctopunctata]|uniref:Autophagy-related protein 2 n=1 Tax=Henosepilachna vigintioctopunctata TaxID=420089 RepID=A0AAW1UW85_9CUCU
MGENHNLPMEFVDGHIGELQMKIPWRTLLKDSVMVEIRGLNITLQPKQLKEDASSMFESMWTSMTSSLKIVEDLAQQESMECNDKEPYNGVNIISSTFACLIRKIRVTFFNTVIQIEHVPKDSLVGVGVIFNIDMITYYDELESESNKEAAPQQSTDNAKKPNVVESFTTKNLIIQGVTISTVEFPSISRTFSRLRKRSDESESGSTNETMSEETESENENDDKSESCFEDADDNEKQRHAILCAKLTKEIKIKIRMNESDVAGEPKVAVDVGFGHFILFLSPRQVYLLSELVDGLANPELEDHTNTAKHAKYVEKPITDLDYQRLDSYLQQQMRSQLPATGGLQGAQGWSEPFPENYYSAENFYPMNNATSSTYESIFGGSLESSAFSTAPSLATTEFSGYSRRKSRGSRVGTELSGELYTFSVEFASFGVILLHEDLLTLNLDGYTLLPSSICRMQETAKLFFKHIGNCEILDSAETNFDQATATLNTCCRMNHLRILCAPIRLDATERTKGRSFLISANIQATKFELVENLFENGLNVETVPLLRFKKTSSDIPPLIVKLKYKKKNVEKNLRKKIPRTDINIILAECSAEIDITIIDRISALLQSPKVCVIVKKSTYNPWAAHSNALNTESQKSVTNLKIQSRYMEVKLRFPVLDFRPSLDANKIPWWKRNVGPDYLLLSCQDISFQTSFDCEKSFTELITLCKTIAIYYKEAENYPSVNIARVECHKREVSEYPRLSIKLFPTSTETIEEQEDLMTQSMFNPTFLMNLDNGPFTSKKVIHQSNTLYERERWAGQELIVPGEKEELEEFKKLTSESTKVLIDIMIPSVKMQLTSKRLYELIYNRIINGLLLWEPNDPKTKPKFSQYSENKFSSTAADEFKPMSNAGESDNEEDGALLFYSTYERPKSSASQSSEIKEMHVQSKLVLNLKIKEGILSCNTPVRDATSNNVIPEQVGDFLLNVDTATIFVVNSYKGDKDLGYVSVQVENGELWHCAMMSSSNIKTSLPKEKDIGTQLLPTFYKSRKGIMAELQHGNTVRDMLTVACKIATKHETHPVKVLTVSIGVNQATLRHRMTPEPNSWVTQMLDFFNINDYVIPGYTSKEVVAEFHLHMWDCAIDYRPLYLPLRSVITIGSFSMTSNMAEKKSTSVLRFIAQECNLYLSEKEPPKNGVPSIMEVNIRRDYINVVSLGSFDLSLRISDRDTESRPYIDMRIANDCVHIYTCSDSGHALTQLITYLASDGDMKSEENETKDTKIYTRNRHPRHDQELICMDQKSKPIRDITQLSKREYEHVDKLLESALYDETETKKTKSSFERSNTTTPTSSVYSASSSDSKRRKPLTVEEITRQYNQIKHHYANRSSESKSQQSSSTDDLTSRNATHSSASSSKRGSLYKDLSVEELSLRYDALLNLQHQNIDYLEEAEQNNEDYFNDSPPRIFYLPEETSVDYDQKAKNIYPQVMKELGDISNLSFEDDLSSDFYFIDKEKDLGLSSVYFKPKVRVTDRSVYVEVDEEYFEQLLEKIDKLDTPSIYPIPKYKYTLCKMNIIWHMYGGNDFNKSKKEKKDKRVSFNNSAEYDAVNYHNNEEVIFEKKRTPVDKSDFKSWKIKGGVNRDHKVLMELELDKVQFQYDIFSKTSRISSRQILLIHEVEIRDLLAKSEFNKFLYQYTSVDMPREALGQMVLIEARHLRPDKRLPTEECSLRLSLLPLRFNIDQDSLKFLVTFFTELGQETDGDCVAKKALTPKKEINQDPILTVNMKKKKPKAKKKKVVVPAPNDNLIIFADHFGSEEEEKRIPKKISRIRELDVDNDTNPIFFREIVFNPCVFIKIDYRGKRVEVADGSLFSLLVGLMMGLGQLNCSELRLKSICYRKGILGADKVLSFILKEWLNDIRKNQMPSLLSGISPLYSIIQLCQGVKDFFWMPIEQYKKDGRIFRGFRKGLNSLSTSTAMATLELTTRFLDLVQFTAEIAYEMLSPNPCVRKPLRIKGRKKRYNQPQDLREGVTNACLLFKHGMGETAESLAQAIRFDSEHMTYTRAVGGVLRQIPPTVLRPIILASEASTNVLGGIKYQLLPDARNEANQKWRCKDD